MSTIVAALGLFTVGCVGCQDGTAENEPSTECGGGEAARVLRAWLGR